MSVVTSSNCYRPQGLGGGCRAVMRLGSIRGITRVGVRLDVKVDGPKVTDRARVEISFRIER